MPEMTNPMDALNSLQTAVNNGIALTQCELNPNIKVLSDAPEGTRINIDTQSLKTHSAIIQSSKNEKVELVD